VQGGQGLQDRVRAVAGRSAVATGDSDANGEADDLPGRGPAVRLVTSGL
jgi:hypothetical protein